MQIVNLKDCSLINEIQQCEFNNFFGSESYNLLQIKKILEDSSYQTIGILDKNIFVGYLFVKKNTNEEFEIQKIFIKEEFRKKGFGTFVLQNFFEITKPKKTFLEVRKSNLIAVNFYLKNNFKKIDERKNYYSDGEAAVVLKKETD